ncbi:MAG: kynureninase [Saprospiraceae bacterium]|nr:kynureninase [Saprospiraceae bacterium]
MTFDTSLSCAQSLDQQDPLQAFQQEFLFPQHNGKKAIYFCGNSLGLQANGVKGAIDQVLREWGEQGVESWFKGDQPWLKVQERMQGPLAKVVGALPEEVIVMNTLTVNIHLLLGSFYQPTSTRFKVIMEAGAFPSDQYAVAAQVSKLGFDPAEAIIEVKPRAGEELLHTEDIIAAIEAAGESLALTMLGGINYYTGQLYDLAAITTASHSVGAYAGFDLAHAAGNVPMSLHDWGVDFAVWCSYKYLNGGPGGPSGVFLHNKHGDDPNFPRLAGWWGYQESGRFLMRKDFVPSKGAAGLQISTPQMLAFAPHWVSLEVVERAGVQRMFDKSKRLTAYLEYLLHQLNAKGAALHIITPTDPAARGSQLSIYFEQNGKALFDYISENGVICDWREDNLSLSGGGVIRVAPVPLYNSFQEVYEFIALIQQYLQLDSHSGVAANPSQNPIQP